MQIGRAVSRPFSLAVYLLSVLSVLLVMRRFPLLPILPLSGSLSQHRPHHRIPRPASDQAQIEFLLPDVQSRRTHPDDCVFPDSQCRKASESPPVCGKRYIPVIDISVSILPM